MDPGLDGDLRDPGGRSAGARERDHAAALAARNAAALAALTVPPDDTDPAGDNDAPAKPVKGVNYALIAAPIPELDGLDWWRLSGWILVGDGCWIFDGPTFIRGYGRMGLGRVKGPTRRRTMRLIHRIVRAICLGDNPSELDHNCLNPACCRPSHLDPVDRAENLRREAEANGWNSKPQGNVPDVPI